MHFMLLERVAGDMLEEREGCAQCYWALGARGFEDAGGEDEVERV